MASGPIIHLNSGESFVLRSVLLYDEAQLREIETLRAKALAKAGPVSSGVGFVGSPGWVLGASAVLSVIESAATKANQSQALVELREADSRFQRLVDSAVHVAFSEIANAHLPYPNLWRAQRVVSQAIDLSASGWGARNDILKRYGKTKADIVNNALPISTSVQYVHNGDDFLQMETDVGPLNVRWTSVAVYRGPAQTQARPVLAQRHVAQVPSSPFD